MKYSYLFFLSLWIFACTRTPPVPVEVQHRGALRTLMHQGDLSAQVALDSLSQRKHLYALGAVEGLRGEILILDNQPLISSVQGGKVQTDATFQHQAALLVYAAVPEWQAMPLPSKVKRYTQLETYLAQAAAKAGIAPEKPFPFLIKGKADTVHWHIVNWPEGDSVHTHMKHVQSGLNGVLVGEEVEILGFYSAHHQGIFTHHSTRMHLHVKTEDSPFGAHVDNLTLGPSMQLYLPMAIKKE